MIFSLCGYAVVPIWHVDKLKTPLGTVDIGLIRDDANKLAPRRGPRPNLPPLGDNLDETVAHTARLRRRLPLTLPRSSLSRVVALPRALLTPPLSPLWSRLLGSKN